MARRMHAFDDKSAARENLPADNFSQLAMFILWREIIASIVGRFLRLLAKKQEIK
jgi:hypothetical protein